MSSLNRLRSDVCGMSALFCMFLSFLVSRKQGVVTSKIQRSMSTVDIFPFGTTVTDRPTKVVHFLRHAEGTHNVNEDYRSKLNIDAPLTDRGVEQCQRLARQIASATPGQPLFSLRESTDLIVTSPLTRCIQTATISLQPLLEKEEEKRTKIPTLLAHEMVRETVNFNSDRRRTVAEIAEDHPHIDFDSLEHSHDDIWKIYEERFGCDETFTQHRESGEMPLVAERGRAFFEWLKGRPEQHVVVCSHSAFMRCLWNYGNNQDEESPLGVPQLPEQYTEPPSEIAPVVQYMCDSFAKEMRQNYENCEIRSMVVAFR